MPLMKVKPTSPGRRALVKVVTPDLHKGEPHWPLIEPQSRGSGRNNLGRITMRHKGGGHKQHYRVVDFRRDKDGIQATVERLDYDPNRSAHLALLLYADGERRYIIAPKGLSAGAQLLSGAEAPIKPGNTLPLRSVPVGTTVHCIGSVGEIRKVHVDCRATIGEVGNEEHNLESIGKAGRRRWRGVRPTVRGVAMNPIDHPHGGGEGRTSAGQPPVSPWGVQTKGFKTRRNKRTRVMIVRDRRTK